MNLTDLKRNEKAYIIEINNSATLKNRLIDMGLVKDTEIKIIQPSVLGSPVEIFLRGYKLTIRKSDAKLVIVRK